MAEIVAGPVPVVGNTESLKVKIRKTLEFLFQLISTASAVGVIGLLLSLAVVLFFGAIPAMRKFGIGYLAGTNWDPVQGEFGALPFIYGTFVSSLLALLFAVPVSIGAALFLTRLAPRWIAGPASFFIELLAAVPSIVYGFWGVASLVPFLKSNVFDVLARTLGHVPIVGALFAGPATGTNMLSAGIVMAIMVVPIITAVTRDVLNTVPKEIEEGALALGATWWQACLAALNFGKLGIFGAIILGFARAIGETMAVTMCIGNSNDFTFSMMKPAATMASMLANEFQNADSAIYLHSLIYLALVLLLLTVALNFLARLLVMRMKNEGQMKSKRKSEIAADTAPEAVALQAAAESAAVAALYEKASAIKIASSNRVVRHVSSIFQGLCVSAATLAIVLLGMIFSYILFKGISNLSWDFFLKNPGASTDELNNVNPIGMKNQIIGTLILVSAASMVGVPFGMLVGIYLSEYAKKSLFNDLVRMIVDVLAGTPSIIVGVLIYEIVVSKSGHIPSLALKPLFWLGAAALTFLILPFVASTTEKKMKFVLAVGSSIFAGVFVYEIAASKSGHLPSLALGPSLWGGAAALAFLMVPIVARTTEEMLNLVPTSLREASLALGGAKYQTILKVVLPAAKTGIITGVMLSIARVAGETAPLLFTSVGSNRDSYDPNTSFPALTLKIYEYATSADKTWVEQAWAGMLVLITLVSILSLAVRYVTRAKKVARA